MLRVTTIVICSLMLAATAPVAAQYTGGSGRGEGSTGTVEISLFGVAWLDFAYLGGSGRGDATVAVFDDLLSVDLVYRGGSGKGDAVQSLNGTVLTDPWDAMENNRVVTRDRFNGGVAAGVFSSATPPTTELLRGIDRGDFNAYGVTKSQGGLLAGVLAKTNTSQLLIKGDFRSMWINPNTGQTACAQGGPFTQFLWLDRDVLVANSTKCYTDKLLTTPFVGNGTSWYNIQNGIAVKINSVGLITELSCQ